jgi:hypothetical protein
MEFIIRTPVYLHNICCRSNYLHMNNQKTMFAIITMVAALSVAAIAPAMMNSAMAAPGDNDPFTKTGNPHDQPGAGDGDPHIDQKTGNPHRCPGATC